jgi:enoyl-CoA hydratase/carnithine racemase
VSSLDRDGNVFVLNLGDDENRYNPDSVSALNAHLDEVEAAPSPRALVVVGTGKIWSNGLDLEWMGANVESVPAFINEVHALLARALEFPVPTIAALNGHTFAAGAMLAIAFDERIMRDDRGYYCLPEVDIRIPFTPGMDALMKARLRPQVAHEAMTTGKRYTAAEALDAEIVQAVASEDQVLPAAIVRANALADKDGGTLGIIKQRLYAPALATLRDVEANKLPGLGD